MEYTILILLLPFLSFLTLGLGGKWMSHRTAGMIGTVVLGAGLLLGFRYRLSGPLVEGRTVRDFFASLREAFDHFLARLRRP